MKIERAGFDDIAALNILVNSAYRGDSSKIGWTTEADLLGGIRVDETSLREMLEREHAQILKMIDDSGEMIACVYIEKKNERLYLGMLTVQPGLQAKGIGKFLMHELENEAPRLHCKSIYMTVISDRTELIEWYERRGYHLTGATEPFPMNNPKYGLPKKYLEFVVMEKNLPMV